MTSEGTDTLILAFTSKTVQSVARNTQNLFYWDFSVRERIYLGILKPSFQTPDVKGSRDRATKRGLFAFFVDFTRLHTTVL